MDSRMLELFNATLGMSIILITLILLRDFKKQILSKDKRIGISLVLLGAGVIVFSIKELIKYGITEDQNHVFNELLETLFLLLILGAFFSLLTLKELPSRNIKDK